MGTRALSAKYLGTEDQHADNLKKATGKESFKKHHDFLSGIHEFLLFVMDDFVIEAC